ncbi:hypothetical protein [Tenacibaculum sp.]|uniref:hypothetical protein n=1 Tax=Tenacibaculum sp. TaxID=1906242 RepID=UPI003D12388B
MKKIIYIAVFLITLGCYSQNQGTRVSAPVTTTIDSITVLDASGLRLQHVTFTSFQAKLKAYFDTLYTSGGLANVVEDLTPQLGGNLDTQGNVIKNFGNFNQTITSNGGFQIDIDEDNNASIWSFLVRKDASVNMLEIKEDGTALLGNTEIADITAGGAKAIITKEYADANYAGGGDVTKVGTPVDNQIGVWTGDGIIEGDNSFRYDKSVFRQYLGVDDTSNGSLFLYGGTSSGSKIRMYQPASGDTVDEFFDISTGGGDLDIIGSGTGTIYKFDQTFNITSLPKGNLWLGTNDSTVGFLSVFGQTTTSGGVVNLYNASDQDTFADYFTLHGSNTGEFEISYTLIGTTPFFQYSPETNYFTLPTYGSGTQTGTAAYGLGIDASGNIIETALGGGGGDDVSTFSEKTGALVGTDRLVGLSGATDFSETISNIPLSIFNNDLSLTAADISDFDTEVSNNASVTANTAKVSEDKFGVIQIACSDLVSDLATGTSKAYFRMPYAATITDIRASVLTAPTGSTLIVDVNESGTTLMTTNKISIDASEKTSETAATAPTLTDTSLADDAEITIDIDQVGSTVAGAGLIVTLIVTRT